MADSLELVPMVAGCIPDIRISTTLHLRDGLTAAEALKKLGEPGDAGLIAGPMSVVHSTGVPMTGRAILIDTTTGELQHLKLIFVLSGDENLPSSENSITASDIFNELSTLTAPMSKRGETWDCDANEIIPDGHGSVVPLPVRLWERTRTGLGAMVGARFELTQRSLGEAWVAFDRVDDHSTLQLHFIKTLPLDQFLIPRLWKEVAGILGRTVVPIRDDPAKEGIHG